MATAQKASRIDLRIKDAQKNFLVYAASLQDEKLSTFVLDSALKEAEEVVAKTVHFALPDKQWKTFCQALDKPAREIPKLGKLFSGPRVFNEPHRRP